MPDNTATIKSMPHIGLCRIIRLVWFPSGRKYRMVDSNGREWHKLKSEIEKGK